MAVIYREYLLYLEPLKRYRAYCSGAETSARAIYRTTVALLFAEVGAAPIRVNKTFARLASN